jgi:hexosaminidase
MGNNVVMTPHHFCYLDYANTSDREKNNEPICGGRNGKRPITLRKAYSFDPYVGLSEQERKGILGVQGNMWTEYVPNFDHVQHMILPRIAAIAEVGWSYGNQNYDDFARRMHLMRKLYDKCGFKYAPYFFNGIE